MFLVISRNKEKPRNPRGRKKGEINNFGKTGKNSALGICIKIGTLQDPAGSPTAPHCTSQDKPKTDCTIIFGPTAPPLHLPGQTENGLYNQSFLAPLHLHCTSQDKPKTDSTIIFGK